MAQANTGSAKRFGARYGRSNRLKVGLAEKQYKKKVTCPYCLKVGVARQAAGIFQCVKCNSKFTGKAYTAKKTAIKEA
jgi:large subunit ribosomal protein L37Ae